VTLGYVVLPICFFASFHDAISNRQDRAGHGLPCLTCSWSAAEARGPGKDSAIRKMIFIELVPLCSRDLRLEPRCSAFPNGTLFVLHIFFESRFGELGLFLVPLASAAIQRRVKRRPRFVDSKDDFDPTRDV
jgi:hypothetical protein